jgi:hypothetical protein
MAKLWADWRYATLGVRPHRHCSKVLMRLRKNMGQCVGLEDYNAHLKGNFWGSTSGGAVAAANFTWILRDKAD